MVSKDVLNCEGQGRMKLRLSRPSRNPSDRSMNQPMVQAVIQFGIHSVTQPVILLHSFRLLNILISLMESLSIFLFPWWNPSNIAKLISMLFFTRSYLIYPANIDHFFIDDAPISICMLIISLIALYCNHWYTPISCNRLRVLPQTLDALNKCS